MGICVLGVGIGGIAVNGAMLHMVAHSLAKGLLFFAAGNVELEYRTRTVAQVTGALRRLPVSGTLLMIGFIATLGFPPFAMFASDLDPTSRRQLARGARLTELLRQPQYSPYPVEEQVVSIWAGTNGKLDEVAVEDILRFERELLDYLGRNTEVLSKLKATNVLDDETVTALDEGVEKFKLEFQTGEGKPLASVGTEQFEAIEPENIAQEQIVKRKR